MFDERLHGYYIHGKSPFGQAEITQEEMRNNLFFESTGKAQIRGITNDDPDLQSYEIFVPVQLMNHYKREYEAEIQKSINETQTVNRINYTSLMQAFNVRPAIPQGMELDKLDLARKVMNRLMINQIDRVKNEPTRFI